MRIKTLFSIPEGEKVTEKALRRVLVSSICSILLCMTCLVNATWAWFTVSIENTGNVIEIAEVKETITIIDATKTPVSATDGVYNLPQGSYDICVQLKNNATDTDDLNKNTKIPVYVLMSVTCAGKENDPQYYYFLFDNFDNGLEKAEQTLQINCTSAALRFSVSWTEPASAVSIGDGAVVTSGAPTEPIIVPSTELETAATTVPTNIPTEPVTEPGGTTSPTETG